MDIGQLWINLGLNAANFNAGLQSAQNALGALDSKMKAAIPGSEMLLGAVTAAGAGVAAFGLKSLEMAGKMETSQAAFTVMLGSAEKATEVMKNLQKFGAETPFEFPEIQKASRSLLAFGVAADDLIPTLKSVGDISSAVGAPIGEIAELYGKAKVQGRLFAEDINQLTGRGIPIIQELAKQFGVSDGEVKKLVETGKIGFPQLETAFQNLTGEGGKFQGMMEAQSKTLPGMWSNLMDNIGQATTKFGQELMTALNVKERLQGVIDALGVFSTMIQQEGIMGMSKRIFTPEVQETIAMIAGAITIGLIPAMYGLASSFVAVMLPLAPFLLAGAALGALALTIYKNWEPISQFMIDNGVSFTGLGTTIGDAIKSIEDTIQPIMDKIMPGLKESFELLLRNAKPIWEDLKKLLSNFADIAEKMWQIIKPVLGLLFAGFVQAFETIIKAIGPAVNAIINVGVIVTNMVKLVLSILTGDWAKAWESFKGILTGALDFAKNLVDILLSVFGTSVDEISTKVLETWSNIKEETIGIWNAIKEFFNTWWDTFTTWLSGWDPWSTVSNIWGEFKAGIVGVWESIKTEAIAWGANIVQGLIDGMAEKIESVKTAVRNLGKTIKSTFTGPEGMDSHSPSRVMESFGEMVSQGLADGIEKRSQKVKDAANKLSTAIKKVSDTMISDLNKAASLMRQEFELATLSLDKNATEADKLAIKLKMLTAVEDDAAKKVDILTAAYETSKERLGENSKETEDYYYQLRMAQVELAKAEIAIKNTTAEITDQTSETTRLRAELNNLGFKMDELKIKHDIEQAALGNSASKTELLALQNKQQSETLELVRQKLILVNQLHAASQAAVGSNAEETRKLGLELLNIELEYTKLGGSIDEITGKWKAQETQIANTRAEAEKTTNIQDTRMPGDETPYTPTSTTYKKSPASSFEAIPGASSIKKYFPNMNDTFRQDYNTYLQKAMENNWDNFYVNVVDNIGHLIGEVRWRIGSAGVDFSSVSKFANGGIVTKPISAIIGEAGYPEAVLPLPKLLPMMTDALMGAIKSLSKSSQPVAGGVTIVVQNSGTIVGSKGMDEFARTVSKRISRDYGLATGGAW